MKGKIVVQGGYHQYDEISFLKGFSITTIVLMHLIQLFMASSLPVWLVKAASFGGTGVHAFFLCSGFGLYLSYKKNQMSYFGFLKKRFLKIYIPYIIVIIISFFVPLIEVNGNRTIALLSHIFLFKMFSPLYEESFGPFWFISTIVHLYIVFIPLCTLKIKSAPSFFALCVV